MVSDKAFRLPAGKLSPLAFPLGNLGREKASRWEVMKLPGGKEEAFRWIGRTFPVERKTPTRGWQELNFDFKFLCTIKLPLPDQFNSVKIANFLES